MISQFATLNNHRVPYFGLVNIHQQKHFRVQGTRRVLTHNTTCHILCQCAYVMYPNIVQNDVHLTYSVVNNPSYPSYPVFVEPVSKWFLYPIYIPYIYTVYSSYNNPYITASDSLDYGYSPPVLQWPAKSRQTLRAVGSALVAFLADALGGRTPYAEM